MKSLRTNMQRLITGWSRDVSWLRTQMMPPKLIWPSWLRLVLALPALAALNYVGINWLRGWGQPYQAPASTPLLFMAMMFWCRGRPITGLVAGMASGFAVVAIVFPAHLLASVPLIVFTTAVAVGWLSYENQSWRTHLAEEPGLNNEPNVAEEEDDLA